MNAEAVIDEIQKMPRAEQQKIHEFFITRYDEELRRKIQAGVEQLDRGETVDGEEMFERLRKRAEELGSDKV